MEKPYDLTPSSKMLELYRKFSEAREKDTELLSRTNWVS